MRLFFFPLHQHEPDHERELHVELELQHQPEHQHEHEPEHEPNPRRNDGKTAERDRDRGRRAVPGRVAAQRALLEKKNFRLRVRGHISHGISPHFPTRTRTPTQTQTRAPTQIQTRAPTRPRLKSFFPSLVPLPVCRLAFRRATYVYFSPACGMSSL